VTEPDLPRWDLSDLYKGHNDPQIETDLRHLLDKAGAFEREFRTPMTSGPLSPMALHQAIRSLEAIREQAGRLSAYAALLFSTNTQDSERSALLQKLRERLTDIDCHLLFFELAWAGYPEEEARALMCDPLLSAYRHFLEQIRRFGPHQLSEPEEKILEEKANTGIRAFRRLFDETISSIRFSVTLEGQEAQALSEQEALALLHDPKRPVRRAAAKGLTEGLQRHIRPLSFILNQVAADHASDDRLRGFSGPMASRHLSNEIAPASVEALLSSCEAHYPLVQRYYRLKKKYLGLEVLFDYDRYAPLNAQEAADVPFDRARQMVLETFHDFAPQAGQIAARFFENNWIDAAVQTGKQGGAYSHGVVPGTHPYVFLNYLGTPRDVMTLAHELGHGVHQSLAGVQTYFNFDTPLTLAETASVFAERLLFNSMLNNEEAPARRLRLLMEKLEEDFSTVFRQVALCRFEQAVHTARREEGELSPDRINQLWMAENKKMFAGSVHLSEDYQWWWSYIPHFIHSPFYTYAYAFGHLLVLSLYKQYRQEGQAFVPKYLGLLSAGGSASPGHLLRGKMGMDITKPDFWQEGLGLLEAMVSEAEVLAAF